MKEKIKKWYKMKLWKIDMVKEAVKNGTITKDEFFEITNEIYS